MKAALSIRFLRRRQIQYGAKSRPGIFKSQYATMQKRHRLDKREAKAGTWRAARGITTIETFRCTGPIFLRYTRSLIRDS